VSQQISEDVVAEALSRGAIGYLLKSDEGSDLLLAGKQRPDGFANTTDDPTITARKLLQTNHPAAREVGCRMRYPDCMDHLEVIREKIERLRAEIADIQQSNEQYRFRRQNGTEALNAHSKRQERLQEIQEELVQLSKLGQKTLSLEQMREKHRSRLHLVKEAS
jgi:hypothetical protein